MEQTKKKPHAFTTLSKISANSRTSPPPGLTIQDMAAFIASSKKTHLHISLNPFSGNSLY